MSISEISAVNLIECGMKVASLFNEQVNFLSGGVPQREKSSI